MKQTQLLGRPASLHRGHVFTPCGPAEFRAFEDGCIAVGPDGRIAAVGDFHRVRAEFPDLPVKDWRPAALLPGLVDTHSHIPQYGSVGSDGYELLPWLEQIVYPAEAAFADPEHAYALARRFFADALACGTTAASVYATIHEEATRMAFRAAEEAGLRASVGKVMMDRNAPPELLEETDASLEASERLCREWHGAAGGRLRYVFTPRFAVSCSAALLREAAKLAAAYGAPIQTHLAENRDELRTVAELFPDAASYTEVYDDAGLLGPRTVMAHCIHLSAREFDLLAATDTRIAHCPSSNFFLRSGIMNMGRACERRIAVGLGSDVAAGPTLSIFEEMAHACYASRARLAMQQWAASRLEDLQGTFAARSIGADLYQQVVERLELTEAGCLVGSAYAFYMATLGGAQALGLADQIGSLAPGKWADFVVVDLRAVDPAFGAYSRASEELLSLLVFRTRPNAIVATLIAGEQRHPA